MPAERMEAPSPRMMPDLMVDEPALADAQKGLAERPTMSIRRKIILGFVALFLLCAGASITFFYLGSRMDQKLKFMETVNYYIFQMQQAHKYERDFVLNQTKLSNALQNIQAAREILERETKNITAIFEQDKIDMMMAHLNRYEKMLKDLAVLKDAPGSFSKIEEDSSQHWAEMISMAINLLEEERKGVEEISNLSRKLPLIFLGILLVVMVYLTHFLAKQIVRPLNNFVDYTLRIARGDFSPIRETKKYKDEFSRLAIAINWMMDQLQKNQEQYLQSRKMAAIGTLTSGIAHEINNPLNNICITAESLLEEIGEIPDGEKRKRLQDIYTQAERASGTVRNLLDFTRMDPSSSLPLSVDELMASTIRLVGHEMDLNNVELEYSVPGGLPKIQGDVSQLQQVFLNLIINSIQAMPRGGTLSITAESSDPEFVQILVTDTGFGIPPAILPHIFDPFFTTKEDGTGLGLSVSYGIVKKHGGKILVKSEVNQGTTFSVLMPRTKGVA